MYEHCDLVATPALQRKEDICLVIAEGLDCALSQTEFRAHFNCTDGGSS